LLNKKMGKEFIKEIKLKKLFIVFILMSVFVYGQVLLKVKKLMYA